MDLATKYLEYHAVQVYSGIHSFVVINPYRWYSKYYVVSVDSCNTVATAWLAAFVTLSDRPVPSGVGSAPFHANQCLKSQSNLTVSGAIPVLKDVLWRKCLHALLLLRKCSPSFLCVQPRFNIRAKKKAKRQLPPLPQLSYAPARLLKLDQPQLGDGL